MHTSELPTLTFSFHFIRTPAPHYLPGVLLDLECLPLGPLGLFLVEDGHHCAHLQAFEDAGPDLGPVQHPGGHGLRDGTAGGLLCAAIEAAAEPGCAHPHCIAEIRITDLLRGL